MAKTLIEKLADARNLVAKYEQQLVALEIANDIRTDDRVTIKFGRGDTTRFIDGRVIGVKDTEQGKVVAVINADLDVFKVNVRDVTANATKADRDAEAGNVQPEQTPIEAASNDDALIAAFENEGGSIASDDPLNEA